MALTPQEIENLQYLLASGTDKIPVQNASGFVGHVLIQDILNLTSNPDLSLYMLKSVYDPNDDGVVVDSDKLGGELPSFYLDTTNITDTSLKRFVTDAEKATWNSKLDSSAVGAANGVAPLNAGGTIPLQYLPIQSSQYKGLYNASTNTPAILNGTGTTGDFYIASVTGNAYAPVNVTVVNQIVIYNGTIWQVGGVVAATVTSVNGLTGVIVLTTNNIADFTNKRYVTDAVRDAGAASTSPSTANPFVTESVLDAAIAAINVQVTGGGVVNPDAFAQGLSYGDGTSRILNTVTNPVTGVPFTNISAASFFSLVSGINVATWELDTALTAQCFRALEQSGTYGKFQSPSNKYYLINQPTLLPTVKNTVSNLRAFQFILDGQSCVFENTCSSDGIMFDRMPANMTEAVNGANNYIQYAFTFRDIQFKGSNGAVQDEGVRLGASYGSIFENCGWYNFDIGANIVFGLQNFFLNCKWSDNISKGTFVQSGSGIISGATIDATGSNGTSFSGGKWRCAPGSYAGLHAIGSDGITISGFQSVFEGSSGGTAPQHHAHIDSQGITTNKLCTINNVHVEQICSRSNFRISSSAQIFTAELGSMFIQGVNNAAFEADANPSGTVQMWMSNMPDNSSGWKLRQNGADSTFWSLYRVRLPNNTNQYAAACWDSTVFTVAGTIPSVGRVYKSPDVIN